MASYQDLDVRVSVLEDKIDLIMKAFTITKRYEHPLVPGQQIIESKTLLDIYRETRAQGLIIENASDVLNKQQVDPTVSDNTDASNS